MFNRFAQDPNNWSNDRHSLPKTSLPGLCGTLGFGIVNFSYLFPKAGLQATHAAGLRSLEASP